MMGFFNGDFLCSCATRDGYGYPHERLLDDMYDRGLLDNIGESPEGL